MKNGIQNWDRTFLALAFFFGALTPLMVAPFNPSITPDSTGYIFMAVEARERGFLSITDGWWPPGYPWLLALVASLLTHNFLFAATIINSLAMGIITTVATKILFSAVKDESKKLQIVLATSTIAFLVRAGLTSQIAYFAWSETTFVALCLLCATSLYFWRRSAGANGFLGWAFFWAVASWVTRFVGSICILYYLMIFVLFFIFDRKRCLVSLKEKPGGLLSGLALLITVLAFNRYNFTYWIKTGIPSVGPSLWVNIDDYFGTLIGLWKLAYFPDRAGKVATLLFLLGSLGLAIFLIVKLRKLTSKQKGGLRAWLKLTYGSAFPWELALFIGSYSAGMITLMTRFSLSGTLRFITPVVPMLFLVGMLGLARAFGRHRARIIFTIYAVFLVIHSGKTISAYIRVWFPQQSDHFFWAANVQRTGPFREIQRIMADARRILWVSKEVTSHFGGLLFLAHFPCHPVLFVRHPDALKNIPSETIVASDLDLDELSRRVSPHQKITSAFRMMDISFVTVQSNLAWVPWDKKDEHGAPFFRMAHLGCH